MTALAHAAVHPTEIHPARLRRLLEDFWFPAPVILFDRIGSTNEAASGARGYAEGALLVAEEQTRGRGRGERRWSSAPGKDLLFSLVLHPHEPFEGLTQLLALAAVHGLEETGAPVLVKWPNDLLLGGRKLAGILAESSGGTTVLGMGLNANGDGLDFPPELAGTAVSLAMHTGLWQDRGMLLVMILRRFRPLYERWAREGFGVLRGEVQSRLCWLGERIRLTDGRERREGRLLGITDRGHIRIGTGEGEIVFPSGDLTLRREGK